jgi:uncharacterized protein (DUF1501 family)
MDSCMDRRQFLRRAVPVVTLPLTLDGLPVQALAAFGAATGASVSAAMDRVLVLIYLSGGNDGINTVIPLDQYQFYQNVRSQIAIPENKVLQIADGTGLHPALAGFKSLYLDGKLAVVQGVSYPNPNLSHFRATDIWVTASGYDKVLDTGWAGRYLETDFPGYPIGYPNESMPHPPAIQIGAVVSPVFGGTAQSMGVAIQDPNTFYQLVSGSSSGGDDRLPDTTAGRELGYVRIVASQSLSYASSVKYAADRSQTRSTLYPAAGRNPLADQLKVVARLIGGGLRTRFYMVTLGGFDTHSNQVTATDTTIGTHATLLDRLSVAGQAFLDDLELMGAGHRVVCMTYSEFGRRVNGNASLGTDHGTAEPVFLFGRMVRGGVVGKNPSLTDLSSGNLKMQFDYRAVYASLLTQWFGQLPTEAATVLLNNYAALDLIRNPVMLPRRRPAETSAG